MPLVLIDHNEGNFGLSRLYADVASSPNDYLLSFFLHQCEQGDMLVEIDIQKEGPFGFGKVGLRTKEAEIARASADAVNGRQKLGAIFRCEGPDFERAPIAQRFNHRIIGYI
jgi:hypothetical protein